MDELAGGLNREPLRQLVDHSAAAGALDQGRRDQLMTAMELDTAELRTLVRPDAAIASVAAADTIDRIRAVARRTGHLRLVVRDSGRPVGVVQALTTLRRQHSQFAMVRDGDTAIGLITMHDLIDRLFPPRRTPPPHPDRPGRDRLD